MSKKKTGLGRGLGALINTDTPVSSPGALREDDGTTSGTICRIEISRITPNRFQPRVDFDADALAELASSIREKGVIQPITVRRYRDGYELISGERRVRASMDAGLTEIPAYILDVDSDREMLELALIENVQRENLNPIEVALGYQRLIKECDLTQEQVAERVGKDRSTVTNLLRLLRLPEEIRQSLRDGEISMGHARALLTLGDEPEQIALWEHVRDEGLSVRKTEAAVKSRSNGRSKRKGKAATGGSGSATRSGDSESSEMDLTLTEIAGRLQHVFGTQVRLKSKDEGSGQIVVDYYSVEDLERLLELFAIIEQAEA